MASQMQTKETTGLKRPRILVVEDEGVVAFSIMQELKGQGYEVAGHANSGEEAVRLVKEEKPELVLMDITLKGPMDGIHAAGIIHDTFKIPVVFLTAHADEATLQRAKVTQPYGYIIKPFEADELRTTIEISLYRIGHTPSDIDKKEQEQEFEISGDLSSEDARADMLSTLSLFSSVPRSELRVLAQSSAVRQVEGGEFLSLPGEQPEIGFVVISGRLAVTKISEAGKELTVELLPPGDAFGILRVLESTPPNTAVRAQIASRILAVHQTALRIIVDKYPAVYREIAEEYSNRMKALLNLAVSLAHAKVESRIVSTLLALAPRFGKSCAQEDQSRIYLTRRELADLAGTTPETAIRITKNFERDGLLDLSRPGIIKILSLNNLRELITGH